MKEIRHYIPAIVVFLALLFSSSARGSVGDVFIKEEKADTLVTVEIANLDALFKKVDEMFKDFGPGIEGFKAEVAAQLFKVADAGLVDFTKPVELIVVNPKKYAGPLVISFSVTDKKKFIESFGADEGIKLDPKTKDAKIIEFTKTVVWFETETTERYYLTFVGNRLIGTKNKALMDKAAGAVTKEIAGRHLVSGDIRGTVNMEAVLSIYAEEFAGMKEMMLDSMPAADMPFDLAAIMELYFEMFASLAKNTEAFEFGALLSDGGLLMEFGMLPKVGSTFEAIISQQKPGPFEYLKTVPADSAMAFGMNFKATPELAKLHLNFLKKFMALSGEVIDVDDEEQKKMLSLLEEFYQAFKPKGAFSVGFSEKGLDVRGVMEIADREKAMSSYRRSIEFFSGKMTAISPMVKVEYKESVAEYKGARIDKLVYDIKFEDAPEDFEEMMIKMFGGEMTLHVAFADKAQVFAMGGKGIEAVKETIDLLARPPADNLTTSGPYISAMKGFPEESLMVFFLSIGNLMKGIMALVPEEERGPEQDEVVKMMENISIAGYATKRNNGIVFGTRIPVSEFIELQMRSRAMGVDMELDVEEEIEDGGEE